MKFSQIHLYRSISSVSFQTCMFPPDKNLLYILNTYVLGTSIPFAIGDLSSIQAIYYVIFWRRFCLCYMHNITY